jgi:hypothetical protein
MLILYRKDGILYFRAGDRTVELTDDVTSSLTNENSNRVFQLIKNGSPKFAYCYNVLTQTGRRKMIFDGPSNS